MSPTAQAIEIIRRGAEEIIVEEELAKESSRAAVSCASSSASNPTAPDLHSRPHRGAQQAAALSRSSATRCSFLIGDFTGMIGDPTGKNQTRPPLDS